MWNMQPTALTTELVSICPSVRTAWFSVLCGLCCQTAHAGGGRTHEKIAKIWWTKSKYLLLRMQSFKVKANIIHQENPRALKLGQDKSRKRAAPGCGQMNFMPPGIFLTHTSCENFLNENTGQRMNAEDFQSSQNGQIVEKIAAEIESNWSLAEPAA